MKNKNKFWIFFILFLISIIGIITVISIHFYKKNIYFRDIYTVAIHTQIKNSFLPFLDDFKESIGQETVDIITFSNYSEIEDLLSTAKRQRLLAVITPIANEIANINELTESGLLATMPSSNNKLLTFSAIQKNLTCNNQLKALALSYNPYVELTHTEKITIPENFAPLHLTGNTEEFLLANYAWVKWCLKEDSVMGFLQSAQKNGTIQKNPTSYTIEDIYQIFKSQLTEKIITPFSFLFDIPKIELENYTMTQTSPFLGTIQGILFPAYIEERFAVPDSTYIKAFDFFASPDFQYEFANAQNFLPARIDSLQRTPHSDAMKSFLLKEGTFINIETQYANEDEKKELLSELKEALSTTKIN